MEKAPIISQKWFESLFSSITALYKGEFKARSGSLFDKTLDELLVTNFTLWQYEDNARRKDLPDKDIAQLKRNIDKNNQKRHNLIDALDEVLQEDIETKLKSIDQNLVMNSESSGSVLDRLSILALRIYHLEKETERRDADKKHIERCATMLKEVKERSRDLLKCLDELLDDYYSGRKRLKSCKQHKLYNDPDLNPSLRK